MTTLAVDEVFVLFFNYHLGTAKDVGPYFMAAVFCRSRGLLSPSAANCTSGTFGTWLEFFAI